MFLDLNYSLSMRKKKSNLVARKKMLLLNTFLRDYWRQQKTVFDSSPMNRMLIVSFTLAAPSSGAYWKWVVHVCIQESGFWNSRWEDEDSLARNDNFPGAKRSKCSPKKSSCHSTFAKRLKIISISKTAKTQNKIIKTKYSYSVVTICKTLCSLLYKNYLFWFS